MLQDLVVSEVLWDQLVNTLQVMMVILGLLVLWVYKGLSAQPGMPDTVV